MPASSSSASARHLVLVAGAGRSGTSTIAGILQRLGLVVPQPEVVTDETNPKGFSESQWVVDFHEGLLRAANVQVSDARPAAWRRTGVFAERPGATGRLAGWLEEQLAEEVPVLVKDPRLSWFLPLWTAVAARTGTTASFVTMLRPPAEVIGSKRTYYNDRLQDAHGTAAWVNMMLGTELATRGAPRTFVRYHDLLDDWRPVVRGVHQAVGLTAPAADDPRLAEIDGFVDPGLRRVRLDWGDLDLPDRLAGLARDTWGCLDALAGAGGAAADPALLDRLDGLREGYRAYYLEAEVVSRSTTIAARQQAVREAEQAPWPSAGAPRAPRPEQPPQLGGREAARQLVVALGRRAPAPLRRVLPARLRARLLRPAAARRRAG